MQGVGIDEGDILVVDRSLKAEDNSIVVCLWNGELLVKKLEVKFGEVNLLSAHPNYPPLSIKDGSELIIWGVVKSVVKDFVKPKSKPYVRSSRRK
jgi:DNA polymerase V